MPLANACPLLATLPRFTSESQILDGEGGEFAGIEAVTFEAQSAPVTRPADPPPLPATASIRMGWSQEALHAHVHVADPAVGVYEGQVFEYYWQGDNVQFFVAPTHALTGKYSGTEDRGATHLIIMPPIQSQPARGVEIFEPCYACVDATPLQDHFAGRLVTDGYEIELRWPWEPAGVLTPGDQIALNFVLGVRDSSSSGLELEGLLASNPVEVEESPCGVRAHPGCDNRTWCSSILE